MPENYDLYVSADRSTKVELWPSGVVHFAIRFPDPPSGIWGPPVKLTAEDPRVTLETLFMPGKALHALDDEGLHGLLELVSIELARRTSARKAAADAEIHVCSRLGIRSLRAPELSPRGDEQLA